MCVLFVGRFSKICEDADEIDVEIVDAIEEDTVEKVESRVKLFISV